MVTRSGTSSSTDTDDTDDMDETESDCKFFGNVVRWGIWGGDYLRNSVEEFRGKEQREKGKGKGKEKEKKGEIRLTLLTLLDGYR